MTRAVASWLESLEDWQRVEGRLPWPSQEEGDRWYYTPTNHGGLSLASMTPTQQSLAMQVLASGLSRPGYVTAAAIIGLENILDHSEG